MANASQCRAGVDSRAAARVLASSAVPRFAFRRLPDQPEQPQRWLPPTRPRPHFTAIPPLLTSSDRRSPWPAAAILFCGVVMAYSGSLHAPFVYDDTLAIAENQTIRRLWPLTDVLWPQGEGGLTVSGRPVLNLSLAINYALSGTREWSYHVFNILVHAGSALLLFAITRRTIARCQAGVGTRVSVERGPAAESLAPVALQIGFAIAALWSLHPLLTQAVTYTVQRA